MQRGEQEVHCIPLSFSELRCVFEHLDIPEGTALVAPLNWGLGHATRCVPLIEFLVQSGREVIIASDGEAMSWLQAEFPDVKSLELPGYDILYSSGRSQRWSMLRQFPGLIRTLTSEHQRLQSIVEEHDIGLVISDHRLGLYHEAVPSVLIAHQLVIPDAMADLGFNHTHRRAIERFDELWIPDDSAQSLSGKMSELNSDIPMRFIGSMSRMFPVDLEKDISVLAVLSGPEPQRSLLEKELLSILSSVERSVLVSGEIGRGERAVGHCQVLERQGSSALNRFMNRAEQIICRSGYSSLMDLKALGRSAILIPTPGQAEQEYLAKLHHEGAAGHRMLDQADIRAKLPALLET